jgi:hypothetical protein
VVAEDLGGDVDGQARGDDLGSEDANGRKLSDTARYRFIGNAATVPVVAWIATRLHAAHHTSGALPPTPPPPPRAAPLNPSPEDSRG